MKKKGCLGYSVALDVEEEIRSAVADVSSGSSLDKIIEEESARGIEASVVEAPVLYSENSASYCADAVELPENYKDSGYKAADDDDDEAEVTYAPDVCKTDHEAVQDYDREIEAKLKADILRISNVHLPGSAYAAERLEMHKISIGFAMTCLLYSIKSATF